MLNKMLVNHRTIGYSKRYEINRTEMFLDKAKETVLSYLSQRSEEGFAGVA